MRGIRKLRGASALTMAIAAGVMVVGTAVTAPQAEAAQKKAAKSSANYSKGFVAAAAPLQAKMNEAIAAKAKVDAGNAAAQAEVDAALAGAPQMLATAEAAASTPADKMAVGQFALNIGTFKKDPALQTRGLKTILASGQLDAAKEAEFRQMLGSVAYNARDYASAQQAFSALAASGQANDEVVELLADSTARGGNPQAALAELRKAIDARKAAGKPVPPGWLKRGNLIAYNAKLGNEAMEFATRQVEVQPNNFNWLNAAQNVRAFAGYPATETVDLFRLMMRSGAFDNEPRFVTNEYKEYVEAADPRRLPGEVLKVIDKGVSSGAITASQQWVSEARATATTRAASDRASLNASASEARSSGSGVSALSTADAYLNYGEPARAEELYKLALQKGGIDKDRALTRLGIAQFDQGKFAEARDNFSKVTGARVPLARLWLVLVWDPLESTCRHASLSIL